MAGKPSSRLAAGTVVSVWLPPTAEPPGVVPAPGLPVEILYADVALIAVNKPPGLVTHPAFGHDADTLVNALVARFPDLASAEEGDRPGIVHRLDHDTSGVMVVARTAAAADNLRAQFKARTTDKTYVALLRGALRPPEGVIDAPIARDPRHRQRMKAAHGGRDAQTAYRVLAEAGG
jgi:23S rRNA pseudouridine1911/1915/1917 synthase